MAQVTIPELMEMIGEKTVENFGLRKEIQAMHAQIQEILNEIPESEREKLLPVGGAGEASDAEAAESLLPG